MGLIIGISLVCGVLCFVISNARELGNGALYSLLGVAFGPVGLVVTILLAFGSGSTAVAVGGLAKLVKPVEVDGVHLSTGWISVLHQTQVIDGHEWALITGPSQRYHWVPKASLRGK